jgi:uncharacterized protein YndB with AHSA1/START domain
MSEKPYDWTRFTKRIYLQAPIEDAFRAWTTPGGIVAWFIAQAVYTAPDGTRRTAQEMVKPGDRYHWQWHQDLAMQGEVLAVEPNHIFQFTFGQAEPGSDKWIKVTVHFTEEDGETLMELTQQDIADTPEAHVGWHLSCNLGWSFFMTNLKAQLEHGIDLREKDPARAAETRAISL